MKYFRNQFFSSTSVLTGALLLTNSLFATVAPANTKLADKQEVKIGIGGDPESLDPQFCNESICTVILTQLLETLVRVDANTGKVLPAAAESYKISNDGLIYIFKLRKNLKWSDSSALTAQDFVYGFQRLVDPKTASRQGALDEDIVNAKAITAGKMSPEKLGVRALDDTTLEIKLFRPNATFLQIVAIPNNAPTKKESVDKYGANGFAKPERFVTNGPYKFVDWKMNDKIIIEKNPNYWDAKNVVITKAILFSVVDQNTEYKMFETGDIDLTATVPVDMYKKAKEKHPAQLITRPLLGSYYYELNLAKPPFKDNFKLRKALAMAIDRDIITDVVLGQGQIPDYDVLPYGMNNYTNYKPDWASWTKEKRIAEAKKLYNEAGYSDKKPLTVEISYNTSDAHKKIATAIASMWQKNLGVHAVPSNMEWKVLLSNRQEGKFEIGRMGGIATVDDAYNFLQSFISTDPSNVTKFNNPQYDKLVNEALNQVNPADRIAKMAAADKILMDELPVLPIYSYTYTYLISPKLKGVAYDVMQKYELANGYLIK